MRVWDIEPSLRHEKTMLAAGNRRVESLVAVPGSSSGEDMHDVCL